ncbi:MAG: GGDEF domain-containing protein [Paracoccaceae bacterium]
MSARSEEAKAADPADDEAEAMARSVLAEAERLGLPPEPETFARLWRRLSGRTGGPKVEPEPPGLDPGDEALLRYGDLLGSELGAVLDTLERRAAAEGEFIERLDRTRADLPRFARASGVRDALGTLRETAADHALRLSAFAAELQSAHGQIAELRNELDAARQAASHDPLTGLANRGRFDASLTAAVEAGAPFALVLADLDHFKWVNDVHGHPAGDAILRHFADILRSVSRAGDLAARYGGEEFALILHGVGAAGARQVAERVRQDFGARSFRAIATGERIGTITASFGLSAFKEGESAIALLGRADTALYRAKSQGRNRVAAAD